MVGIGTDRTVALRYCLNRLMTGALACAACGLSAFPSAVLGQSPERTCSRVERSPNGLEIWMWTECADDPVLNSPRGGEILSFLEQCSNERLPASPLAKPASVHVGPRPIRPFLGVSQAGWDGPANPIRSQELSRCQFQPTATTAAEPIAKVAKDKAGEKLDGAPASTPDETFYAAHAGVGAGQQRGVAPIGQTTPAATPQVPSRQENAPDKETGSLPQLDGSHDPVKPGDRGEQLVSTASLTPHFVPLLGFLAGLTFYLIVLPVVVFLILFRCAKRYGLILQVELANSRRPGHGPQGPTDGVHLRDLNAPTEDHFRESSTREATGSACAVERPGTPKCGPGEEQTLLKQVFDDNTGLRRQIASIGPSAA